MQAHCYNWLSSCKCFQCKCFHADSTLKQRHSLNVSSFRSFRKRLEEMKRPQLLFLGPDFSENISSDLYSCCYCCILIIRQLGFIVCRCFLFFFTIILIALSIKNLFFLLFLCKMFLVFDQICLITCISTYNKSYIL